MALFGATDSDSTNSVTITAGGLVIGAVLLLCLLNRNLRGITASVSA